MQKENIFICEKKSNWGYRKNLISLISIIFIPPLCRFFLPVSSTAIGLAIACSILLLIMIFSKTRGLSNQVFPLVAFLIFLPIHFFISILLVDLDIGRFIYSLFFTIFIVYIAIIVNENLFGYRDYEKNPEKNIFLLFIFLIILSILDFQPEAIEPFYKPIFPFTEPSFFAIAFEPFLIWICVTEKRKWISIFYIAMALLIGFFLQNLTMLVCAFFAAFVSLAASRLVVILFAVSSALLLINPDIAYFVDRLTASNESNNLSALVYIQGWEMIQYYFSRTYGWGIGFQQLGETYFTSPASTSINALIGMDQNLNDGSFIISKLCSEFGFFGLIACVIYVYYFFRALNILRKISRGFQSSQPGKILALSIFISYSINLFIRESGYFTGSGFLFLSSILFLSKSNFFPTFGFRKR